MFGASELCKKTIIHVIFPEHAWRWLGLITKVINFQFKEATDSLVGISTSLLTGLSWPKLRTNFWWSHRDSYWLKHQIFNQRISWSLVSRNQQKTKGWEENVWGCKANANCEWELVEKTGKGEAIGSEGREKETGWKGTKTTRVNAGQ